MLSVPRPEFAPPAGPVFIVGAPRSGTTLLQYMLRSHPALSLPTGESHFFVPLYRNASQYGDLTQASNVQAVLAAMYAQSANFLDTDLHGVKFDIERLTHEFVAEGRHTMRDLITGLFEKNAAGEGKRRWGDKTPYYVLHLPKLLEWWPNAQIIHIIRDGRDVALSLFARKHDFGVYNAYFAARYWEQYVETGHNLGKAINPAQYLEIRYEDLIADQAGVLKTVCDFLGEPFSESVVDFKKSGEAGKTPMLQKAVQKDNAEKWRTAMTPNQLRAFERGAGKSLEKFGYRVATSLEPLPLPVRALYRWHNAWTKQLHRFTPLKP
ncbi:MAG: sulfotransferase family protein [Thiobacillaceae bacterium]